MAKSKCRAGGGGKARTGRQSTVESIGWTGIVDGVVHGCEERRVSPSPVKFVRVANTGLISARVKKTEVIASNERGICTLEKKNREEAKICRAGA